MTLKEATCAKGGPVPELHQLCSHTWLSISRFLHDAGVLTRLSFTFARGWAVWGLLNKCGSGKRRGEVLKINFASFTIP